MYCKRCGTPIPEHGRFCPICGLRFQEEPPVKQPEITPKESPAEKKKKSREQFALEFHSFLGEFIQSPLFVVTAIAFTFSLLLTVIEAIEAKDALAEAFALLGLASGGSMSSMQNWATIYMILSIVPPGLVVIGLWMIYHSGRNNYDPYINTSGFSLIIGTLRTIYIAMIVLLALPFFELISLASKLSRYGGSSAISEAITRYAVVFTIVSVLIWFIYSRYIKTLQAVRDAIEYNEPGEEIPVGSAYLSFISAGLTLLLAFEINLTFNMVVSIAQMIILGCLILSFRNALDNYYAESYNERRDLDYISLVPEENNETTHSYEHVPTWKLMEDQHKS